VSQNVDVYWIKRTTGGPLKRGFDLVVAATALVLLAPVMLTVGLLIKLRDGGAIFFKHPRIGRGGKVFNCWKFRSMVANGAEVLREHLERHPLARKEWERTQKLRTDPRVTPIGKFLRSTSLDELPQLFNVLLGDMSIVGPRPVVGEELRRYNLDRVHYLSARPGLTGLWQVSGRNDIGYDRRVALDKSYVIAWSFFGDLQIVLKTIPALLASRGVY
jgi:exopolysaccharide production protein ExoY